MPSSCACPIWYHDSAATKAKDGIVRDIFRVCLYTSKHFIGFLLGVFALFLFIFPLFPQYVLNFRSKSAAGLSVWFVFLWLVGDTMNMTSCVLTRQTPLQLYTAIYFAVSDIFLVAQVCWRKLISSTGCIVRILNISRTEQRFGRACGYISASCYIFGRFFQISKNFVRKSTKGISLYMFCNVALANMLYAAAILLQKESKEERMNSFTFLLGSLGTIACDLVIFIQSRVYRRSDDDGGGKQQQREEEEEEGEEEEEQEEEDAL
ncbi:unnamed protein product [Bathycoccus prasinos]